ncbi:methyltransferase [Vibrio sonorensis]|uniref:methyltransferase n=1 Tax=Vibrio sonorensis TaxID=1004316 RepID=UPI0008DA05ED|nr:methyltransferase [Vibrio sonorensis]
MLISAQQKKALASFLTQLGLTESIHTNRDKQKKRDQLLGYIEVIHSQLRKYSKKRPVQIVECGAGNCLLSFTIAHFYTEIEPRPFSILCIDRNKALMDKNAQRAATLGFDTMTFQTCDIIDASVDFQPTLVCSLHACDTATDQTLAIGIESGAKHILSVSCCQHSIRKTMGSAKANSAITKHRVFKDRMVHMIGDSLRALILEQRGFKVDIIEFTSSHATEKNIMVRAHQRGITTNPKSDDMYVQLSAYYQIEPLLTTYLSHSPSKSSGKAA